MYIRVVVTRVKKLSRQKTPASKNREAAKMASRGKLPASKASRVKKLSRQKMVQRVYGYMIYAFSYYNSYD